VIVVDAGGDLANALMGELMLAYAIKRGVVGFVLNGAIRDLDNFRETNLPTYAAGVTHRGPYKDGPGEINVPVAIDGMVIHPGDIVIGDSDGVLSVPIDGAEEILKATEAKSAAEIKQMAAIEAGTNDRSWVDRALIARGCILPDA
jgi:regulator of RNase E activity RraA